MYHVKQMSTQPVSLTLKQPFQTAHGTTLVRPLTLVKVWIYDDQTENTVVGFGEIQSFADYRYALENQSTSQAIIATVIQPMLRDLVFESPKHFATLLAAKVPYGAFAKAGVEMAVWDAVGKLTNQSLQQMIGGVGTNVPVGMALGMPITATAIRTAIQAGYRRLKLKIDGQQTDFIALFALLQEFPEQMFSLDANSSFDGHTVTKLQHVPDNVAFIEQPFEAHDFVAHAALQKTLRPALSLDESINHIADIETLIALHAADAVTIKQGKIGGITAAISAINKLQAAGLKPWIGGMLSSNLGRGVDLALASLSGMSFPGDISASARYFESDLTTTDFTIVDGTMKVPTTPGIGVTLKSSVAML
ncbi:o-succinylbenzoate synthase [Leuconostoc holzapfelii]|uniref:o-succinylbenzoate synthase n=1 Tax=Leuconostoc holzapfelii TaxID=434464 RepID=A0ABT2NX62_9LACO|nr:o-succinylbenzoate synthase [Leuconostoc holzapfelii]MCT8389965.1 o-succinylbenzoate synthase [Leuconostoc holzapfelii]